MNRRKTFIRVMASNKLVFNRSRKYASGPWRYLQHINFNRLCSGRMSNYPKCDIVSWNECAIDFRNTNLHMTLFSIFSVKVCLTTIDIVLMPAIKYFVFMLSFLVAFLISFATECITTVRACKSENRLESDFNHCLWVTEQRSLNSPTLRDRSPLTRFLQGRATGSWALQSWSFCAWRSGSSVAS